ncbi:MAG: menaquinone biosynthesis protein [Prevotellaceae bacterium]|jgi:chorismate dehydratase|nr:menaquinone biosynthesis protein [Prevotellaceae bacterium]
MKKIKVSVISYLNTLPFVYGLKHSKTVNYIDFIYDTPAKCAVRLANRSVDIGIVPAAVIPEIPDRKIISKYCIGASGTVRSVVLCSNEPLSEIKNVYLDGESRTSALLARLLLAEYWKIDVSLFPATSIKEIDPYKKNTAYLLIGDKVFDFEDRFMYKFDLSETWKSFTGMSFVFAAWTAVNPLPDGFISMFDAALSFGIDSISEAARENKSSLTCQDAVKYLTENIDYNFDYAKHKALVMFWNMVMKLKSKYRSC